MKLSTNRFEDVQLVGEMGDDDEKYPQLSSGYGGGGSILDSNTYDTYHLSWAIWLRLEYYQSSPSNCR